MRGGRSLAAVGCTLGVMLVGCGDGSEPRARDDARSPARAPSATQPAEREARPPTRRELERSFAPNRWKRPTSPGPHPGAPVKRLVVRDVALGSGRAVRPADAVYADLIKAYWKTGVVFYVAWGPRRAEWLSMPTQAPGMRRGIVGMRAGGRRTIVMPQSVSDVHAPDDSGWEAAHVDVVVRKVLPAG